jgi:hypothetical protein
MDMFRPDPNGGRSVDEVIAKLSDVLAGVRPGDPLAQKLAEMIRGLREMGESATRKKTAGNR